MYCVFKNKRATLKGHMFETYEQARQALRKHIRKLVRAGRMRKTMFDGGLVPGGVARWDDVSRNPVNYTNAGYSIQKV
jgi:hypothetical protein